MASVLEQLRNVTKIVVDSANIEGIDEFSPVDATTNPSLVLLATKDDSCLSFIKAAINYAKAKKTSRNEILSLAFDKLFVLIGKEILKRIPGRVSTEIDARLAFDKEAQIERGLFIIKLYEEENISKERILIKVPSTWEGIQAARVLENEHGIHCNMTLLFNFHQAVACAEAGVSLISPFVGRILDWYVKNTNEKSYDRNTDPGVKSVEKIYKYYKKFSYKTEIMGASFRNTEQIKGLFGCDLLTISTQLLRELASDNEKMDIKLAAKKAQESGLEKITVSETIFRFEMNEDAMASDRLADGIRRFVADGRAIESLLEKYL